MYKRFLPALLIALLLAQSHAQPGWVKECHAASDEWYCGSGANNAEAMGRMVNLILVKIKSETEQTTSIIGRDAQQNYTQKVEASSGNIEIAGIEFYTSPNGTVYAAAKKADVAKGFAQQLRPVAASLEFSANAVIDAKHPKLKNEAWQKTQSLWNEFAPLIIRIEGLDKEKAAPFKPASDLYAKARENYLSYCKTAKLYWNPEKNDIFSNVAFSKLSKNLKLEKASCNGHGISLIYKNAGHKCIHAGMFKCSHKPSMLIASCRGEEYRLLENPNIETFQKVEDVALKKLPEKLDSANFWNEWEQEIKQWKPICE